jgi:DNA repair protein RadC
MDERANGHTPYILIRDLPSAERPRERLRDRGADALSVPELLAILIRTGTARQSAVDVGKALLKEFGSVEGIYRASIKDLCHVKGLGEAKAIEIKAALELGARLKLSDGSERPTVNSPDDAARLVLDEMSMFEQEHVRLLILDARNRVLDAPDVYVGSVHTAQVRVGELLKPAVRANASSIVLVHNHPSGDPSPSAADVALTKSVREAAKLLDIDFPDHVVIGGGRHVSMREHGMGFDDAT